MEGETKSISYWIDNYGLDIIQKSYFEGMAGDGVKRLANGREFDTSNTSFFYATRPDANLRTCWIAAANEDKYWIQYNSTCGNHFDGYRFNAIHVDGNHPLKLVSIFRPSTPSWISCTIL